MANIPKISVIVPVYNTEKFLQRCIDSILAQTYTDFELLLIDDGSKDSSGAICDEYTAQDTRVRVFHKENGGVITLSSHVGLKYEEEFIAEVTRSLRPMLDSCNDELWFLNCNIFGR